jgi:hypothetical protein
MTDNMTLLDALKFGAEGEFTQVAPSSRLASPTSHNPLARAHFAMMRELARMAVPSIGLDDDPEDFEAVADYVRRVTDLFDVTWLQAVGEEVKSNALCHIDMAMFSGQFVGAIDGNATFECQCAADAAREAQDEGAAADATWNARNWA